jgi:hypothetical protein
MVTGKDNTCCHNFKPTVIITVSGKGIPSYTNTWKGITIHSINIGTYFTE